MTKFHAHRNTYNGIKFDSIFESRVYQELRKTGIGSIATQYPLELLPKNNFFPRDTNWKCDFLVRDGSKSLLIEAKSIPTITREFELKMRILSVRAPNLYREILFVFPGGDFGGWEKHGQSLCIDDLGDKVRGIFK